MTQFTIENGTRQVVVTNQEGRFSGRLYVNSGETATLQSWKGKSEAGARKWASKVLGDTIANAEVRKEMLSVHAKAEAAGVDGETLDRIRLATEFFTNPEFRAAMTQRVWEARA
jgi:hypothetical protein